jgi:hypothetical protein
MPCSDSINEAAAVQELTSPATLDLLAFAMSALRLQGNLVHQRTACGLSVPQQGASVRAKASKLCGTSHSLVRRTTYPTGRVPAIL